MPRKKRFVPKPPVPTDRLVLHSCCAPCSTAVLEFFLKEGFRPVVFYCNPNIHPRREYEIRKEENKAYCRDLQVPFVDGDYDTDTWHRAVAGFENEPERGARCSRCFLLRLSRTAAFAADREIPLMATTLATSRWKDLEQINRIGMQAASEFGNVAFWAQNWRKGGLTERRNLLVKEHGFYQQQYCGCVYSLRDVNAWRKSQGRDLLSP
ncbi:MAG: epoxyqueuosine reductase QueH [Fibrobacterota bacterium]